MRVASRARTWNASPPPLVGPLASTPSDLDDEIKRIGLSEDANSGTIGSGSGGGGGPARPTGGYRREKKKTSVNERLINEIAELEAELPRRASEVPEDKAAPILGYKKDLDGINPAFAGLGSLMTAAFSYATWQLTVFCVDAFGSRCGGH